MRQHCARGRRRHCVGTGNLRFPPAQLSYDLAEGHAAGAHGSRARPGRRAAHGRNPKAMEELNAILKSREALYSRAEAIVNTSGKSPTESRADLRRTVTQLGIL